MMRVVRVHPLHAGVLRMMVIHHLLEQKANDAELYYRPYLVLQNNVTMTTRGEKKRT